VKSSTLRQIWSVIEENQANVILGLCDAELVRRLLIQLDRKQTLSIEESGIVQTYLYSRTNLIRDLALARQA
jgi:hypothetical protein